MKNKLHITAAVLIVVAIICEMIAIIGSWIMTTVDTDSGMQSLLTAEGVRWYIGCFADVLARPLMVWILLFGCSYGIIKKCDIMDVAIRLRSKQPTEFIERIALQAAGVVGMLMVVGVMLLAFGPHTVLLSATGTINNSSFSAGIIPIVAILSATIGITYGYFSSRFKGVTDLFDACVYGVTKVVPLLILYLFIGHLYMTVRYLFN